MIIGFVYDKLTDERLHAIYEDELGRMFVNQEFAGCETDELMAFCSERGYVFEYLW